MITDEKVLRKWEQDPLRYKTQIRQLDREITERFRKKVESKQNYYNLYRVGTPEWMKGAEEDLRFLKLMTRVTKMCTAISDKERQERMKQLCSPKPLKPKRRIVISNDAAQLTTAAEVFELERIARLFNNLGAA